jgi:hypothetical protein
MCCGVNVGAVCGCVSLEGGDEGAAVYVCLCVCVCWVNVGTGLIYPSHNHKPYAVNRLSHTQQPHTHFHSHHAGRVFDPDRRLHRHSCSSSSIEGHVNNAAIDSGGDARAQAATGQEAAEGGEGLAAVVMGVDVMGWLVGRLLVVRGRGV